MGSKCQLTDGDSNATIDCQQDDAWINTANAKGSARILNLSDIVEVQAELPFKGSRLPSVRFNNLHSQNVFYDNLALMSDRVARDAPPCWGRIRQGTFIRSDKALILAPHVVTSLAPSRRRIKPMPLAMETALRPWWNFSHSIEESGSSQHEDGQVVRRVMGNAVVPPNDSVHVSL